MGCYETFYAPCPKCGADWESQSKLGECILADVHLGEEAPGFEDMAFQVKSPCQCGLFPVVVIKDGRFTEIRESGATVFEGLLGAAFVTASEAQESREHGWGRILENKHS